MISIVPTKDNDIPYYIIKGVIDYDLHNWSYVDPNNKGIRILYLKSEWERLS